uniref:NXF1/2/3/5-like leucine-rich repeat domain-containing protein n=2 Tax=Clytia hemisphaerica TaxID=252671 RepID=A0A7M5WJL9_9CNID
MLTEKEKDIESLKDLTISIDKEEKIDISSNLLTDLDGIESCEKTLKWLNVSHNRICSVKHLKGCTNLNVLNLSNNKITSLKHLKKLQSLKAIILNGNELSTLDGITGLKELNTLVISNNKFTELDLNGWPKLQKFSATNNHFEAFPNCQALKSIGDIKLNHNAISEIPEWIKGCSRLKILDLGNNKLENFESIVSLKDLPNLENLNLKGNPLCDDPDYIIKVKEAFPKLKTFDFKKLSELYFKAITERSKREKKTQGSSNEKSEVKDRGFKKSVVTSTKSASPQENESDEGVKSEDDKSEVKDRGFKKSVVTSTKSSSPQENESDEGVKSEDDKSEGGKKKYSKKRKLDEDNIGNENSLKNGTDSHVEDGSPTKKKPKKKKHKNDMSSLTETSKGEILGEKNALNETDFQAEEIISKKRNKETFESEREKADSKNTDEISSTKKSKKKKKKSKDGEDDSSTKKVGQKQTGVVSVIKVKKKSKKTKDGGKNKDVLSAVVENEGLTFGTGTESC